MPLVVVGFAYSVAQGLIYLYAKSGATVSRNSTSILVVLMFGVGTDYCLLLLSPLPGGAAPHRGQARGDGARCARAGPAILASGLTVALDDARAAARGDGLITRSGRCRRSASRACFVAGLTLLPAMLTIFGRRGFWPRRASGRLRPDGRRGRARGHLAAGRRPGAASGPGCALAVTVADVRRRRARPARLQGELQRRPASSRSRPRAWTASRCSSRRSRPARSSRRRCSSCARTGRCAPPTWRRCGGGSRGVPGVRVDQRRRSSAPATARIARLA